METLEQVDEKVLLWLNGWVGHFPWLDAVARVVVSDYFMPVLFAAALLGLWFGGREAAVREAYQRGVMIAASALGLVNIWALLINQAVVRARPFFDLDLNLDLFYRPTDPSFPAHPVMVTFAVAAGVYIKSPRPGMALFAGATLFALARLYAGLFYPSDVVAGALLGIATAYFMAGVFRVGEPIPTIFLRFMRALCLA